jgi:hypothetical protein
MSIFSENRNHHYDVIEGTRFFFGFIFWVSIFIVNLFSGEFLMAIVWTVVGPPIAFIFGSIMVHIYFNLYDMFKS